MFYHEEKEQGGRPSQDANNTKRKTQSETAEKVGKEKEENQENEVMETDTSKGEDPITEEKILSKLLDKWRHLDERFIPEEDKKLYRETFQKYKEKQDQGNTGMNEQLGIQPKSNHDQQSKAKGGKKGGRRNLQESIQVMGEMLVNMGRVVPLSAVFHQTIPTNQ